MTRADLFAIAAKHDDAPGNEDTPANEAAHLASARKLHTDNRAFHDANKKVFGHD